MHNNVPTRKGSIYLPVLFVGAILTALCVGGLTIVRANARTLQLRADAAEARLLAQAGLDAARAIIKSDPLWRTNRSNGTWLSGVQLNTNGGTFTVSVTNPNGALNRNQTDSVTVTSVGTARTATQTLSCTIGQVAAAPLSCLSISAGGASAASFSSASISGTSQLLSTNGLLTATLFGNNVSVDLESTLSIFLFGFSGHSNILAASRTYPDTSSVFDYYTTNGTTISYSSLPSAHSGRDISNTVISPATNPYGATNSLGIYIIDCGNGKLTIEDCRLVGTFVILNASSVVIDGSVNITPAADGLPAILVQGPLQLAYSSTVLSESGGSNPNFNPAGTPYPYPSGSSDNNENDTYPSTIDGLVYATGNISVTGTNSVHTLLTNATLSVSGTLTLKSDGRYSASGCPGFQTLTFGEIPNSRR